MSRGSGAELGVQYAACLNGDARFEHMPGFSNEGPLENCCVVLV